MRTGGCASSFCRFAANSPAYVKRSVRPYIPPFVVPASQASATSICGAETIADSALPFVISVHGGVAPPLLGYPDRSSGDTMSQTINIPTEGGEFSAYIARPTNASAPVVVVLHEVFGVNEDMRQTCLELADRGFIDHAGHPRLFLGDRNGP